MIRPVTGTDEPGSFATAFEKRQGVAHARSAGFAVPSSGLQDSTRTIARTARRSRTLTNGPAAACGLELGTMGTGTRETTIRRV